jgi:hypothetical protein
MLRPSRESEAVAKARDEYLRLRTSYPRARKSTARGSTILAGSGMRVESLQSKHSFVAYSLQTIRPADDLLQRRRLPFTRWRGSNYQPSGADESAG